MDLIIKSNFLSYIYFRFLSCVPQIWYFIGPQEILKFDDLLILMWKTTLLSFMTLLLVALNPTDTKTTHVS